MPPAEMQGATMHVFHNGITVKSVVSYIGSTVFQMTPSVTRRYDLDSQHKVGPYIRAISKKLKESGVSETVTKFAANTFVSLVDLAEALANNPALATPTSGYPPIWANSPWANTTVLNPGAPMANQMKSDADDLLSMLGSNAPAKTAATEPPMPTPRVEEGDPTSNSTPPHRRSVIKGLRDPKTYLQSLSR